MRSKKVILTLFVLVALVQIYVPAKMILDREEVLTEGTEYKFKTAPIDPYDPFRGKYIILSFPENRVSVANVNDWQESEKVYAFLTTDDEGFAQVDSVSKEPSDDGQDYLVATVRQVIADSISEVGLEFPFNRYYMEEFKAPIAEQAYREANIDAIQEAYARVMVKEGEAVLKDVFIDGLPIREVVKRLQNQNP